mgnify:FL=1
MSASTPLDPRAALETISEQQAALRRRTLIRSSPLLAAWGLAWLVGYGAGWLGIRPDYTMPAPLWVVYFGCLAAAGAYTCTYIARRARWVRGSSNRAGVRYGTAWAGGFVLGMAVMGRTGAFLASLGTPEAAEAGMILGNAVPCLIIGTLFVACSAIWDEPVMAWVGGWLLAVTTVATLVGGTGLWAIMSLAGGGVLIVAAVDALRTRAAGRAVR